MTTLPGLSPTEMLILQLLVGQGEMYGLQLVAESAGALRRGTVYVTLDRMERKGYVESRKEAPPAGVSGPERRLYRPSGHGVHVLAAWELAKTHFALASL